MIRSLGSHTHAHLISGSLLQAVRVHLMYMCLDCGSKPESLTTTHKPAFFILNNVPVFDLTFHYLASKMSECPIYT